MPGSTELGALTSGDSLTSAIGIGDLNSYSFDAGIGDSLYFGISGDIAMWLELYSPSGENIAQSSSYLEFQNLPETGTYTVIVRSYYIGQFGQYDLHFVKVPGNIENGPLILGNSVNDHLTPSDLDSYQFTVNSGEDILLSIEGDVSFFLEVYSEQGDNIGQGSSSVALNDLASGTYTVIVRTFYTHQTGSYTLTYSQNI